MISSQTLLEIFVKRPQRYRLLTKGWSEWMGSDDSLYISPVLEIGCAYGDAAAYLGKTHGYTVYGVDHDPSIIEEANRRHSELVRAKKLRFICGNAEQLPLPQEYFAGIVMEASFSPLINKAAATSEFYRVLKHGGRILLNDFAAKEPDIRSEERCSNIPCFKGVESMVSYRQRFEEAGFTTVHMKEEHGELVNTALWLAKNLEIPLTEIEKMLFPPSHTEDGLDCCSPDRAKKKKLKLTYSQMVFEKG